MRDFWEFITESEHTIKMSGLDPSNDMEKIIYNKRYNIKKNFDLFSNDVKTRRSYKSDDLKLLSTRRKNEGIFAENIARIIFKGENLNHFTKNHPYVDIAVMKPMEGITKENELISIKSTLEISTSVAKILTDTKAIKFDSLLTYLIYSYNLYKNISQPFSINELQRGIKRYLQSRKISQEQHKDIIYILIEHIIEYTKNFSNLPLGKFETSLISDVEDYLGGITDISDTKNYIKKEMGKLYYPISLAVVFIGPNDKMKNVKSENILNVYKTDSISLGDFFFKVMKKWADKGAFAAKKTKYLNFGDILDVYGAKRGTLFPTKIHIDFTDFGGKERGNKRQRLYIATELKDGYFDEYEEEVLTTIHNIINDLEKDPSKVKKYKNFLNDQ